MRLNQYDKKAFVDAVMADVPKVNYNQQVKTMVENYYIENLPFAVRAIYDVPELRKYIGVNTFNTPSRFHDVAIVNPEWTSWNKAPDELKDRIVALAELNDQQNSVRNQLQERLEGIIAGCSSLKQAQERLPEFLKYLPADRNGSITVNLPAISGLVADLTKAGWPKAKE